MSSAQAADMLVFQVIQESQVVTYRKLGRELQVDLNTAKQLMQEFYEANKAKCHATFLIVTSRNSKETSSIVASELSIRLVSDTKLSEPLEDFEEVDRHIYALSPRPLDDNSVLAMANVSAGSNREMADLSAISASVTIIDNQPGLRTDHAAAVVKPQKNAPVVKNEPKPIAVKKEPVVKKEAVAKDEKGEDVDMNDSQTPEPTKDTKKPKDAKSFFGRQIATSAQSGVSKKHKADANSMEEDELPVSKRKTTTTTANASASTPKTKPKPSQALYSDDVAMHSADEDKPVILGPRVEDMFDDDSDDDFGTTAIKKSETTHTEHDSDPMALDSQLTTGSMTGADSDVDMTEPSDSSANIANQSTHPSVKSESNQSNGRRRVRKQRKVTKTKHATNKRGMLVTETVDEWESYSESESDSEATMPKPAAQTNRSMAVESAEGKKNRSALGSKKGNTKGAAGAAGQRSLFSFFNKKD